MKALTVRQPHASLIAVGAKPIETRSWSTKYRGPLIVHAGLTVTPYMGNEAAWDALAAVMERAGFGWDLWRATKTGNGEFETPLPLGAVVASGVLADVVPIHTIAGPCNEPTCIVDNEGLYLYRSGTNGELAPEPLSIEDQRPFGDFTPGRFAWLLEDVKPTTERCPACWTEPAKAGPCPECGMPQQAWGGEHVIGCSVLALAGGIGRNDQGVGVTRGAACTVCGDSGSCDPIPAKGHQGLWEWTP